MFFGCKHLRTDAALAARSAWHGPLTMQWRVASASSSMCAGKWCTLWTTFMTVSISVQPYDKECFIFTALHIMQTRYSEENSVRPSVCLSVCPSVTRVIPDKTEERSVQIFIPYERIFILVFWEEEWLVGGRPLLREILGQPTPVGTKSPIFNQ